MRSCEKHHRYCYRSDCTQGGKVLISFLFSLRSSRPSLFPYPRSLASLYVAEIFQPPDCSTSFCLLYRCSLSARETVKISRHVYNFSFLGYNAIVLTEHFLLFYHCRLSKSDFLFPFTPAFATLTSLVFVISRVSFCAFLFFPPYIFLSS